MGEYGTPDVDIPEGFFEVEYRGRRERLPFPRQAGSWYHLSKVHDSHNVDVRLPHLGAARHRHHAGRGLRHAHRRAGSSDPRLSTRLDFDQCFGTAVNRFCCQAVIGEPLTPFGAGGQQRGFLPLRDSMQCLTIALENPPAAGEYRVFNQFANVHASARSPRASRPSPASLGLPTEIAEVENPRSEAEAHYYNPDREHLVRFGYEPTTDVEARAAHGAGRPACRIAPASSPTVEALLPDVRWDGSRRPVRIVRPGRDERAA